MTYLDGETFYIITGRCLLKFGEWRYPMDYDKATATVEGWEKDNDLTSIPWIRVW